MESIHLLYFTPLDLVGFCILKITDIDSVIFCISKSAQNSRMMQMNVNRICQTFQPFYSMWMCWHLHTLVCDTQEALYISQRS